MQQCNGSGKAWVATFTSLKVNGSCAEDLVKVACDPVHVQAYFKSVGVESAFTSFIADNPGFSLYNCGLKDGMLMLHWMKNSSGLLEYASIGATYQ